MACVNVVDFDDDDPLAGLLSDDESNPKKKAPAVQKPPTVSQKEVKRPRTGPKDDEDDLNSASKILSVDMHVFYIVSASFAFLAWNQ